MQLFVRNLVGKTVVVETEQQFGTVRSIKEQIEQIEGIPTDDQILIFAGHILPDDQKLASNCSSSAGDLSSGSAIHLSLRLNGGGSYDRCDPKLVQLAKSFRWDKLICRNCYARLPLRASNCRKCGSSDLRKRKTMLSKPL
ncbi:hypothetical protein niasHS_013913 [Heterodera schachtii]|uniref:Ubiquitin-ribosomal protein eL40 fusion protein n=1 Tax=Heterodera schachtii TaxID=97005 RepID=A0ABD2IQA0_HETSC